MEFGERVRAARVLAGISRARLAKNAGVTYACLAQIERGERKEPRKDTLVGIARALQIDVSALLADSPIYEAGSVAAPVTDERRDVLNDVVLICEQLDVASLKTARDMLAGLAKVATRSR